MLKSKPGITRPVGCTCHENLRTEPSRKNRVLSVPGRRACRHTILQLLSVIVTISFFRTCRLKIQAPIRLIQHSALSVHASFISSTVLPGNPSDGTQALPCIHIVLLRISRSLVRDQPPSALAEWVVQPTRSATRFAYMPVVLLDLLSRTRGELAAVERAQGAHTVYVPHPGARPGCPLCLLPAFAFMGMVLGQLWDSWHQTSFALCCLSETNSFTVDTAPHSHSAATRCVWTWVRGSAHVGMWRALYSEMQNC